MTGVNKLEALGILKREQLLFRKCVSLCLLFSLTFALFLPTDTRLHKAFCFYWLILLQDTLGEAPVLISCGK